MKKITDVVPLYCENIPEVIEEGILYISLEFKLAIHLCACGCKRETTTPINTNDGWTITDSNGLITLRPSIGNWKGQSPYHAHYYITNNKIEWL